MNIREYVKKCEIMSLSVTAVIATVNSSKITWNLNNNGGIQPKSFMFSQ